MPIMAWHPKRPGLGNTFIVDLILTAPLENAVWSDGFSDTINYATVYETVKAEMAIPRDFSSSGGAYLEGFEREISTDHGGGTCLV